MQTSTVSNREFTQRVAAARLAASTNNLGEPSGPAHNIQDQLAMPEAAEIDLDIDRAQDLPRSVNLS